MIYHLPVLIVVIPVICACFCAIMEFVRFKPYVLLTTLAMTFAFVASIACLNYTIFSGPFLYDMGGWKGPIGIVFYVDELGALMLVLVSGVSLFNLLATDRSEMQKLAHPAAFYALYLMYTVGMMGILVTADLFNLYVLLEIASLTVYAMIASGREHRATFASLNYLFIGSIGASLYLLGVGYIYLITGSLNMFDVLTKISNIHNSQTIYLAFAICMLGLFVKMAQFPFHTWLPRAYGHNQASITTLMAPLSTKVMVYVMIHLTLNVFTLEYDFGLPFFKSGLTWLVAAGIIFASIMALYQKTLRSMFAFIIVAEVGYMVGGFWCNNPISMAGAILHMLNDVVMTATLFLGASIIYSNLQADRPHDMKDLFAKMPVTMACMVVAALAVIGVPPFSGFFSKFYLIQGAFLSGHYELVAALLFSSLMMVAMFFRLFEKAYFSENSHHGAHTAGAWLKTSPRALTSLVILALTLLFMGLFNQQIMNYTVVPYLEMQGYL